MSKPPMISLAQIPHDPVLRKALKCSARSAGETFSVPGRKKGQSVYEKYQLPFFDKKRLITWAVEPTGNYQEDFEKGVAFAIELLKSNDQTHRWEALVSWIISDMVRAGPTGQRYGRPEVNGIVTGFGRTIGRALAWGRLPVPVENLAQP